ncbi:MAG: tetratricopeptide repeat protein [Planctomycetota bacterium]
MTGDTYDPTVPRRGGRTSPSGGRPLRTQSGDSAPVEQLPDTKPAHASRQTAPVGASGGLHRQFGRFRLGEVLGQGGVGTVHLADDPELGRELAIKYPRSGDADSTAAFVEEAQITAQLEHPNIVPVHDLGRDAGGRPWLVMKRIEGQSLADVIAGWKKRRRRGGLQPEDLDAILAIFGKACDAVAFAHSRGVIHRDLKPHNIMVGEFGEVLVVDWGLARSLARDHVARPVRSARRADGADITLDGEVFGTPAYMPPEQADGRVDEIDERADVFALGAVLYHMLTLHQPYDGRSTSDTLAKAARHLLTPPRRRAPQQGIPKELQAIVLKAMAAEPDDRYATVRALQDDLAAWRSYRPTTAWRAGLLSRAVKWTRRHPTAALSGALLLVAGLVVAVLLSQLQAAQEAGAAAEAREEVARLSAERAVAQRDAAREDAEVLGELAYKRVSAESRAAVNEYGLRRQVAHAGGMSDESFNASLSRQELERYLESFDDLFRVAERIGQQLAPADHVRRGLLRMALGNPDGAVEDYRAALRIDPDMAEAHFNIGVARQAAHDLDGALNEYTEALRLNPRYVAALNNRGHALFEAGRRTEAMKDFDAALRIDPRMPDALNNRGTARRRLGDVDGAIRDFDLLLEIRPRYVEGFCNRGNAYFDKADYDRAIADYTSALDIMPTNVLAWVNRGNAGLMAGRFDDAIRDYTEALRIKPDLPDALNGRGNAKAGKGDQPGAIRDYDAALALDPRHDKALHNRAVARHAQGDYAGAVRDCDAALRIVPDSADALGTRGNAYFEMRQMDAAIRDYQAALKLDPARWWLAANLGAALADRGRMAEALASALAAYRNCNDPSARQQIAVLIRELGGTVPE